MPDQTVEAPVVLRPPEDLMKVTEIVAAEFAGHEDHVRSRTLSEATQTLRGRARHLRATNAPDPLVDALTDCCHTVGGLIHADPRVVAEVAYEAVAVVLAFGDLTRAPDRPGCDRTDSDASGAIRTNSERSEAEADRA